MAIETILIFQVISLMPVMFISIYNFFTAPVVEDSNNLVSKKVSILIPARNEEQTIDKLLNQVLASINLGDFEVLVLDDHSTDQTANLVKHTLAIHPQGKYGRLLTGTTLPNGWLGKPWACQQLSQAASGDYLVFLDADVQIQPWYIASAIQYMEENEASMLSSSPTQIMQTWGEKLLVSYINWLLLSFLPLRLIYSTPLPSIAAANGQFILFRKEAYKAINGHTAVANQVVDDVNLAKQVKAKQLKVMFTLGGNGIACRMYTDLNSAVNGLTKNINKVVPWPIYVLVNVLITITFLGSFFGLLWSPIFLFPLVLVVLQRLIVARTSLQSMFENVLLIIPQFVMILYIELRAFTNNWGRGIKWKSRTV